MIYHQNSNHSITIEGSKEEINNLKQKISRLLGTGDPISDNLFIELQSVFKAQLNKQGQPYTISVEEALKVQNKKPESTNNCINCLKILGNKEVQKIELPRPPIGDLPFDEVKNKFGFIPCNNPREYEINVPEDLIETFKLVKKSYLPDEKGSRFSVKEDENDPKSILYNFEAISNNKIKVRRSFADKDDEHFVYTALRCLCFYQSKSAGPILNLFKRQAAYYLLNCLPEPTDLPLNKIPQFHCEFIDQPDVRMPPVELFSKNPVRITVYQAMFLVEIFCETQDKYQKCNFNKPFLDRKTVYLLSILSPLPVAFELKKADTNVELTFADTSFASADFIFEQVRFAMGIFSKLPQFSASFNAVDSIYWPSEKFITVNERLGFSIIRGFDSISTGKAGTFQIWSILNKPLTDNDHSQLDAIKKECSTIYNEIKLYMCDQCDEWFSDGFGGECVIYEHEGNRTFFPGTQEMERVEEVQEGSQLVNMVTVYYECCGEKPLNAPGCCAMVFPSGHKQKLNDENQPITCSSYAENVYIPE